MKTDDFDFYLPEELIAQTPLLKRDSSKMMVLDRKTRTRSDHVFTDIIDYLEEGDTLVLNDTKVLPARLHGIKEDTKAHIEILLLKEEDADTWQCLVKPAKRIDVGTRIIFSDELSARCLEVREEGIRIY